MNNRLTTENIAIAIYTVNRHAKTAIEKRALYTLKNEAIRKLLIEGRAQKIGLHFVDNPQYSKQSSTVLVECGEFLFHTLPEKSDFDTLPHLGEQDQTYRNPKERMNLRTARMILDKYVHPHQQQKKQPQKKDQKMERSPMSNTTRFRSSYFDS
ncbi:YkyB family protein [Sporosarcina sp. Te-1]|uniref:YkyB family protein n=1 Tax=Sporosarcina sp. Te-1 TaxID=2818390 RepID=UPI001FB0B8A8|nr:YkyB family protein [Sporosarcina sp. Te-1]